jgi:hypothetical protein
VDPHVNLSSFLSLPSILPGLLSPPLLPPLLLRLAALSPGNRAPYAPLAPSGGAPCPDDHSIRRHGRPAAAQESKGPSFAYRSRPSFNGAAPAPYPPPSAIPTCCWRAAPASNSPCSCPLPPSLAWIQHRRGQAGRARPPHRPPFSDRRSSATLDSRRGAPADLRPGEQRPPHRRGGRLSSVGARFCGVAFPARGRCMELGRRE